MIWAGEGSHVIDPERSTPDGAAVDFANVLEPLTILLDELPVAACLVEGAAPYPIVTANGAFGALTERPVDAVVGRPALDFLATDRTTTVGGRTASVLETSPEAWAGRVRVRQREAEVACLVAARQIAIARDPHYLLTLIDAAPLLADAATDASGLRSAAFESAPTPIGIFDMAGKFLDCNDAMAEFFGRSRAELMVTPRSALLASGRTAFAPEVSAALVSGKIEAFSFEATFLHADGHPLDALTSVAIHFNAAGEPEYFVAEITRRPPSDGAPAQPIVVLDAHRAEDLARAAAMRTARARVVERYSLTERDDELLDLLLRGHRVASIASEMFLASGTVRNNLSTLYHRVGVTGQAELLEMLHDLADQVMREPNA